jgi:hypothetical protein
MSDMMDEPFYGDDSDESTENDEEPLEHGTVGGSESGQGTLR